MHNTNTTYIISQLCRWVISSISLIILIETDLDCWRKGSQFSIANCTGTSWTYSPHFWARWVGQHVMGGNHFFLPIRGLNLLSSYVLNFVSSLNFWGIVRYVGERAGGARHGRAREHEGECQRGQHKWEFTVMLMWSEPRAWIQDLHHRLWTSEQRRSDDGHQTSEDSEHVLLDDTYHIIFSVYSQKLYATYTLWITMIFDQWIYF